VACVLAGFCLTRIERSATAPSAGVFALQAHMDFAYMFNLGKNYFSLAFKVYF